MRRTGACLLTLAAAACITPPVRLYTPPIRYPDSLHAARVEGQVRLRVVVDTAGNVVPASVRVLSSTNAVFEAPAREAVLASLYRPGRRLGRVLAVAVTVPVFFTLRPPAADSDQPGARSCLAEGASAIEYFRILVRRYHPEALAVPDSRMLVGFVLDSTCRVLRHGVTAIGLDAVDAEAALADLFPDVAAAPGLAGGVGDAAAPQAPGAVWVAWIVLGR